METLQIGPLTIEFDHNNKRILMARDISEGLEYSEPHARSAAMEILRLQDQGFQVYQLHDVILSPEEIFINGEKEKNV